MSATVSDRLLDACLEYAQALAHLDATHPDAHARRERIREVARAAIEAQLKADGWTKP
jgi:hypothetical protein